MKTFKHSKSTSTILSKMTGFVVVVCICAAIVIMVKMIVASIPLTAKSVPVCELPPATFAQVYQSQHITEATKTTEKETHSATEPTTDKTYNYSEDVDLLARVIYLESGACSEYCQWLVGSTAMNLADERGGLEVVAYDYNTFNVAYDIDYCTPSDLSYAVAERVLSGDRDHVVKAFRDDYYHDWATPYTVVDNMYFSTY